MNSSNDRGTPAGTTAPAVGGTGTTPSTPITVEPRRSRALASPAVEAGASTDITGSLAQPIPRGLQNHLNHLASDSSYSSRRRYERLMSNTEAAALEWEEHQALIAPYRSLSPATYQSIMASPAVYSQSNEGDDESVQDAEDGSDHSGGWKNRCRRVFTACCGCCSLSWSSFTADQLRDVIKLLAFLVVTCSVITAIVIFLYLQSTRTGSGGSR
ncbi:hypothetical protein GGR53DRAFT_463537 [Hypoxylon sp. FL1150]|nr:hypothetical protein GGR53DRAFT_463537 [Hypoxylon sp. FL1150]